MDAQSLPEMSTVNVTTFQYRHHEHIWNNSIDGAWICTHICRAGSDLEDEDRNGTDSLMAAADYPKSLFNKGVRTQDEEHIGHVMKETEDKIVVFGHYDWRFDVPKDKIIAVGRNVILGMDYADIFKYKTAREAPLPEDTIASY